MKKLYYNKVIFKLLQWLFIKVVQTAGEQLQFVNSDIMKNQRKIQEFSHPA